MGVLGAVECTNIPTEDCICNQSGKTYEFDGGTYYFNGTSSGGAIQITNDNIVLNCNNSILIGNNSASSKSIYIHLRNNVSVRNCEVRNHYYGVFLSYTNNSYLENITSKNIKWSPIVHGENNIVRNSYWENFTSYACTFEGTSNNTLEYNVFNSTELFGTQRILFLNDKNSINSTNNKIIHNLFFGNDLAENGIADYDFGSFLFVWNNTMDKIKGNSITIQNASNNRIENNTIKNNNLGSASIIILENKNMILNSNNVIIGNYIINSSLDCIRLNKLNGNNTILFNTLERCRFGVYLTNASDNTINNNNFNGSYNTGVTNRAIGVERDSNNILIENNTILNNDVGIIIWNCTNPIIRGNYVFNSTLNNDGYNVALRFREVINGTMEHNIVNLSSTGILIRKSNFTTLAYNNITLVKEGHKFYNYFDVPAGISILELYETWLGGGDEMTTDDNISFVSGYASYNVTVVGNKFYNTNVFLRAQGTINLFHDLSSNDYWYRSHKFPTYLVDKDEYYISNSYNNVSLVNSTGELDLIAIQGYYGGYHRDNKYSFTKTYSFYHNTNLTISKNSNVYSLTSSNSYYNCTISSGSILTNSQANLTLQPNKYCYIGY